MDRHRSRNTTPREAARRSALEAARPSAVSAFDRGLARRALGLLGDPPIALVLWDGNPVSHVPPGAVGRVHVADRAALLRMLLDPDLQVGELYREGRVDVEGDLPATLEAVYRAMRARPPNLVERARARLLRQLRNTPRRARHNVHRHYDLGNEFYALWLDREWMQYTCAYFPDPALGLEAAQAAKLHHVCRKLRLRPGQSVIEAGCGWGGLARFMARHYGVRVRAYNVSREQVLWARERVREEGLGERVEIVEDDYRNIRGRCDAFVSVGMLEHVGPGQYRELGRVVAGCLGATGLGLIHTIGRHAPGPLNPWIRKRIFPGTHPPTLAEMAPVFEPWGFSVLDVENLRLHYARTLEHWLSRFAAQEARVARMFDEPFVRTWRLYLAGSIAAFRTGSLQLFQIVFTRAHNDELAWSRAELYAGD